MGRTALNVCGTTTVGTVTSRFLGQTDLAIFKSDARLDLSSADETQTS